MKYLKKNDVELEDDIIDSLDKIRSENPDLFVDVRFIKAYTLKKIKRLSQLAVIYSELNESEKKELSRSLRDIFKLLGLVYPHDDMMKAYQNLKSGTKNSMAYAVELLDNTLSKALRDRLLPIIEQVLP